MAKLFNLARMSTATSGTGTITLGVAISGYLSFSGAGVTDQDVISYAIKDGSNSENGTGLYTASGTTLTRNVAKSTNSNTAISLSGTAEVFITPRAEDFQPAVAGQIFGLTLSTAGSSSTFSVAAGRAADSTAVETMILASAISKTTGAWSAGTGNGALDTSSIGINTWYHAHLIKRSDTGAVDVLISLSGSSPALPANYTWSRRVGSMLTDGGSKWTAFSQNGDEFLLSTPVLDITGLSVPTTASTQTLPSVPIGVKVTALLGLLVNSSTGANNSILVSSLDTTDTAPSTTGIGNFTTTATATLGGQMSVRTNTSAQFRIRASTNNGTAYVTTQGWIDRRGRDA